MWGLKGMSIVSMHGLNPDTACQSLMLSPHPWTCGSS